ncbi:MAG: hypothetical protein CALGDGBN_00699 [Pseudomonadales bacterium]|nr:hypothetical protein [Pseudomonadales bacterium]
MAIVPVVLYHVGMPLFSGGFVGVDVFFVISGFLITSIIYREMVTGTFSFAQFYDRRIRRLFPALFTVIAATSIAALWLLMPGDLLAYARSVIAATLFGANLLFWRTSGYFDEPAEMKPLLHAWSLSVEEQFYIFFPVMLLLLVRRSPKHLRALLVIAAFLSFAASVVAVKRLPDAAFYLPLFRAWELLLGALVAIQVLPPPAKHWQRDAVSVFGLMLILYAVFALSDESTFPGFNALYPAIGTALIIYAGSAGHGSIIGKALSWRPLVLIGLISYSLYLWHWPLIVFTKHYVANELVLLEKLGLVLAALLLAALSWRFIERPFRGRSGKLSRRTLFATSFTVMLAAIIASAAVVHYKGLPQRVPAAAARIADVAHETDHYRENCQNLPLAHIARGDVCGLGLPESTSPDFLLWGDSHAMALAPAFHEAALHKKRRGWFLGRTACAPLLGVERYDKTHNCVAYNDAVMGLIEQHPSLRTVILAGRWGLLANSVRYGSEPGQPVVISPRGAGDNRTVLQQGLERTVQTLRTRGIEVVFMMDVPEIGWQVPVLLSRAEWHGRMSPEGPRLDSYRDRQQPVVEILEELVLRQSLRVIEVSDLFCPEGRCLVAHNGMPLYRDDDHLSTLGASFVAGFLLKHW